MAHTAQLYRRLLTTCSYVVTIVFVYMSWCLTRLPSRIYRLSDCLHCIFKLIGFLFFIFLYSLISCLFGVYLSVFKVHVKPFVLLCGGLGYKPVMAASSYSEFLDSSDVIWSFLPCDALRCTVFGIVILSVCPSVCLSVCPSVCLSVTLVDCVHTVWPTIMISSPYGSPIILM